MLWLGHSAGGRLGAVAGYLASQRTDVWPIQRATAELVYGPMDRWPRLSGNDLLAPYLGEWIGS